MEERVISIHGLLKWLRLLCLELGSRCCWEVDVQEHGWSDNSVCSENLGEILCPHQALKTTCAWVHMPRKLSVRHPDTSGAGLPGLLSQAHVPYILFRSPCGTQVMLKVMQNFNHDVCKGKHFSCDTTLPAAMKSVWVFSCLPGRADLSFGWSAQLWSYCSFVHSQSWCCSVSHWCS